MRSSRLVVDVAIRPKPSHGLAQDLARPADHLEGGEAVRGRRAVVDHGNLPARPDGDVWELRDGPDLEGRADDEQESGLFGQLVRSVDLLRGEELVEEDDVRLEQR